MQEHEELNSLLVKMTDIITTYWKDTESHSCKVIDSKPPKELRSLLDLQFPTTPTGWEGTSNYIKNLLQYSPRTRHPLFLDKLYPGTNPIGVISELVTAALNTNVHVYKVAPVIVHTELAVMEQLCSLFGIQGGDGITCPGGSFSNMLAMITARNLKFPAIKRDGYRGSSAPLVAFTSDQAHYSIKRACMVLGIGTNNLIPIQSDNHGAMRIDSLRDNIKKVKAEGKIPFFLNATAGTTVRGAFDPFTEIGKICKEENIWLHIDACWGGSVIFSNNQKYRMNGSEMADSIAWNAHKMIGVPIQTSILLMKRKNALLESNSLEEISYLFHEGNEELDVGKKTIMCGRRADALKLFITWQYYGSDGFALWVDKAFDNAMYMTQQVEKADDFQLVYNTESVNVCFRYVPDSMKVSSREEISQFNQDIHDRITKRGNMFIDTNSSPEHGMYYRVVFHSPLTEHHHIDQIIEEIRNVALLTE